METSKKFDEDKYLVTLKVPDDVERTYSGLSPRQKKEVRDAFCNLIRKMGVVVGRPFSCEITIK